MSKAKINSDRIYLWIVNAFLLLFLLICAYPLYFVVIASISDPAAVNLGRVLLLPKKLTLDAYRHILENKSILIGYKNTIIYTTVGTLINICVLLPGAFALSRKELPFRKAFIVYFMITMYFGGGLIPTYLQVRSLGLMDTMWALVLPGAFSVYNSLVCKNFFEANTPADLFDSARMDGAGYTTFFFSVVLPISKAIIAVMVLFHALGHWNSYMSAMYYITNPQKYPLQLVLKNMQGELDTLAASGSVSAGSLKELTNLIEGVKYSIIPVSTIPVALLYPFAQKYFVKGVTMGSIKG